MVNLEDSSQHFANMDKVTYGIGQLIGKHIITVPALMELIRNIDKSGSVY